MLRRAVEGVLDPDAFNAELDRERDEAARLEALRRQATAALGGSLSPPDGRPSED
jgi:hypothetical protein